MNLTDTIILEFHNGYFEVQHKKVAEDSGNVYLSNKKTFSTLPHLEKYLTPYRVAQDVLTNAIEVAKKEAGIKTAKQGLKFKERRA